MVQVSPNKAMCFTYENIVMRNHGDCSVHSCDQNPFYEILKNKNNLENDVDSIYCRDIK